MACLTLPQTALFVYSVERTLQERIKYFNTSYWLWSNCKWGVQPHLRS